MDNEKSQQQARQDMITALGYAETSVQYRKAEPQTAEETVQVRQVRARDIPKYHPILLGGDEELEAEFYCDKPAGWAATLTPESFNAVLDTGQEINLPLWSAWFRRTMRRNDAMGPGWTKIVTKAVEGALLAAKTNPTPTPAAAGLASAGLSSGPG